MVLHFRPPPSIRPFYLFLAFREKEREGHRIFEYLPEKTQTFHDQLHDRTEGYPRSSLIIPRDVSRDWCYDTVGNGVFFVSLSLFLSFSRIEFNQDPARSRLSFCFEVDVGESRLTGKVGNWRPRKRNNLCFLASIVRYPPPRLIGRGKSKQYHSSVINRLN